MYKNVKTFGTRCSSVMAIRLFIHNAYKPVVDVARDAQCCVHTRDSSCRGQTDGHTDGQMDGQTLCDNKG